MPLLSSPRYPIAFFGIAPPRRAPLNYPNVQIMTFVARIEKDASFFFIYPASLERTRSFLPLNSEI